MTRPTTQTNAMATRRKPTFRPRTEGLEDRKLLTAGALDSAFGTGGYLLASGGTSAKNQDAWDTASTVQVQSDGKILASGWNDSLHAFETTRVTSNGTIDSSFGSGGFAKTALGSSGGAYDMALMGDGRFVVVGEVNQGTTKGNNYNIVVVRYLPSGALDTSFGGTGKVALSQS